MADTIEGLMQEAQTFADSRSWDQAIESYSKALELDANNDEACRNLAQIYALRGMLKSVISTYLQLMHIYVARSDMDNAMAVANYVLLLEPESVEVRSELIKMYRYRGDTAEVVARSLDLARLYTELDEGDRSIELLQAVLNDDPSNADICRELAEMYIQYGQVERGANQYHQVADLYQASGQLDKACEALERILVVNSNDSGAVFHLGELYSMLERWEDAEKQFRNALKFDFENLDVMFALGNVCQRKGDLDQASLAYRKIIMSAPDYVLAQERLGEVYHLQNNIESAIKAYLTAAGLYVRSNEPEHAIALYQRVIFLDPNNPTATRELTNLGAPVVGDDGGIQPLVKAKAAKGAKSESRRDKKDGEHKTRSGLVPKGGGGMRAGLMAKGGGAKPGLGGKPMLGGGDEGENAPRPGLMRAGLKAAGSGKPTLGGKPMLGSKRVLGSRRKKNENVEVEAQPEHKVVSLAKEPEAEQKPPVEHEAFENNEVSATEPVDSHVEESVVPAENIEPAQTEPTEEVVEAPEHEIVESAPAEKPADPEPESDAHYGAEDEQAAVTFNDFQFEPPKAPVEPLSEGGVAPAEEQHDNSEDALYAPAEVALPESTEQFGAIEQQPFGSTDEAVAEEYHNESQAVAYDGEQFPAEHNQFPAEHDDSQEYYAGQYSSETSSDEFYGAAPEHSEQLEGADLQSAPYAEHDAQLYDEHGQFVGTDSHEAYADPNAQAYGEQPHEQFEGAENYDGAYPEYYDLPPMRPLIMVPEGQLIVPTPILYLERTDLYEAICQNVTEAPDQSVIPWEPLKDVDEAAIEEKMAQQSVEVAPVEEAEVNPTETENTQNDFQSVEGFDFNAGVSLKGVSGTGLRRKHSKSESSGRSSKLMGSQSLSERMARMRAENAESEEPAEHRTISGINRHHQEKPQKKERGRSIMGGISRPINQVIEEANQSNGTVAVAQESAPEVPRPELTSSRSRSSLSERIKKARQSKAAAKAQSEEMAAVNAEQSSHSAEQAAVAPAEQFAAQPEGPQFAPPAGYEQPAEAEQLGGDYNYQPEAQPAEGEQLGGDYAYQSEAQPAEAEQLGGDYNYQPEAQPVEAEQLGGDYAYQSEAQPAEAEQLGGSYNYQPEAQPAEAEQLGSDYNYQPETQPTEAEQLGGDYAYQPEAHPAEAEQLGGEYAYQPEAQPAEAEQLGSDYNYQPEAQPAEAEQLGGDYNYQPEAQPVEAEQLGSDYNYQPEAQPAEVEQLGGDYNYQPEAQPTEAEQLGGDYAYQPEAQPAEAEQLGSDYNYQPETQPTEAEQLGGDYAYQPEAQPTEAEQLGGDYAYQPEAQPAEAGQLGGDYAYQLEAQPAEAEQLGGDYAYQPEAQPAEAEQLGSDDSQFAQLDEAGASMVQFVEVGDEYSDVPEVVLQEDVDESEAADKVKIPVRVKRAARHSHSQTADIDGQIEVHEQVVEAAQAPAAGAGVSLAKVAVGAVAIGAVAAASSAVADGFAESSQDLSSYETAEPEATEVKESVPEIEQPAVEAIEPETAEVEEPMAEVEQPAAEAIEPEAAEVEEPVIEVEQPAVEAVEVETSEVEEPMVEVEQPAAEAIEPETVEVEEQVAEVEQPAVEAVEVGTSEVEEPMAEVEQPAVEAIEPEAVEAEESIAETEQPVAETAEPEVEEPTDGLCSLSVESELPPEYLEEAQRLREKLVGADVTTAIGDYRRAIENSPENLVLRTDLADVHLRFSLMDDAINQYRQILRRKPDSVALRHRLACAHLWNEDFDEAVNVYLDLAELHTKNEQYADVIDVLQTVLSLEPQNFKARRLLIDRFIAQGKTDLAIHHLRQFVDTALSLNSVDNAIFALKQLIELSDDPAFVERLAKVYEDHDNVSEAVVYYRILSKRYTHEEKWAEALAICEKLVSLEPDNFDERRLLISLYHNLGRYDKAVAEQFKLAGLYREQSKVEEAAELYEAIIQKDPNHYEARRCLVDCYLAKGDLAAAMIQVAPLTERYQSERLFSQAIEMYKQLVEADPTSVELREKLLSFYTMDDQRDNMLSELLTLDEIHEGKGEYREAVRYLRRAIELAPERAELHCRLAKLYDEQLQSISGAMQEYKKVFELNPGDAPTMTRYAQLLVNQRKPKDAASVLLKLQSIDKEVGKQAIDSICQSFLDKIAQDGADLATRFSYGELCYHLNRISDAIEQFQKTHADRDLELRSRNMLGLSFIKMPRMREMAIRQFRLGLDTKGHAEQDYLELRYNLAMLFYQTDRLQEALTEFKSILAFDVTYRDVEARVKDLQAKIAAGGGASKGRGVPPRRK